jgi:toxin ParE1/3/4
VQGVAEVSFSNAAVADLCAIDEYSLTQFGEEIGEAYMQGFDKVFTLLKDYPLAGSEASKYGRAYRCMMHRRHRIFYVVRNEVVLIIRILHHAVDTNRALRRASRNDKLTVRNAHD